jgi:hypothetical protein
VGGVLHLQLIAGTTLGMTKTLGGRSSLRRKMMYFVIRVVIKQRDIVLCFEETKEGIRKIHLNTIKSLLRLSVVNIGR